jgi:hypothetical protein
MIVHIQHREVVVEVVNAVLMVVKQEERMQR